MASLVRSLIRGRCGMNLRSVFAMRRRRSRICCRSEVVMADWKTCSQHGNGEEPDSCYYVSGSLSLLSYAHLE